MTTPPHWTAHLDQYRAATRAARSYALADAETNHSLDLAQTATAPPWLQAILDAHNTAIQTGGLRICHDLASKLASPTVVHIAPWAPGTVACHTCAEDGALDQLATLEQALTCSVCGQQGTVDTLTGGRVQGGPFIIEFTVHRDCPWTSP